MKLSGIERVLTRGGKAGQNGDARPARDRVSEHEVAGQIGERFETIQGNLDELTDMAQRFSEFEGLLTRLREPLEAEFRLRRDSHVEIVNLRAANAEAMKELEELRAASRRLSDSLAEAESRAEDLAGRDAEKASALQEVRAEMGSVRGELAQAAARISELETADRASAQRIRELEQDHRATRDQLKLAEAARSELESGRAHLQRDHALAQEENLALRRRVDEIGAEIAGLARTAAASEGQLATERARAASEQAEAARTTRGLENQLEASRAEIAALNARLETVTARAGGLETLNTEQAARLSELQSGGQAAERRAAALQISLDRAQERTRALEAEAEDARQRHASMEAARVAAVDRAEALTKAALGHEKAIARAEERMLKIQAKLTSVQDESTARIQAMSQQMAVLREELEAARAEAAMASAALESVRRERPGRPVDSAPLQAIVG